MSNLLAGDSRQKPIPAVPTADQPPKLNSGAHIAYLDGLRGIAILAVLMVHASLGLGLATPLRNFTFYGVRGVQLFFIVSGMTLMQAHIDRALDLTNFAARRFFRVAPMFYLGAIIYLALGAWTTIHGGTHDASALDIVATFLFLHGWLPSAINKVVPGGWSIAAEAMLYVIFPAILALARQPRRLTIFVIGSYIVAGATNLLLIRLLPPTPENRGFAMAFWLCQVPAFAGGCLLAAVGSKIRVGRSAAMVALFGSVIGLIVDSQLRGHSNLLVAILLMTIFVWAIANAQPHIFLSGFLPYLGRISFSVYILHFLVLGVVDLALQRIAPPMPPAITFVIIYVTTLALVSVAATLTFRFIEQPFVKLGRKVAIRPAAA